MIARSIVLFTLIAIPFLAVLNLQAQGLKLESEGKEKMIPLGNYISVYVYDKAEMDADCENCRSERFIGQLVKFDTESLVIKLMTMITYEKSEGYTLNQDENYSAPYSELATIPFSSIFSIKNLGKNSKANKRLTGKAVSGGISIMAGLTTALSAFVVKNKSDRNNLFALAGAEFGLGVVLLCLRYKKNYIFEKNADGKRVWQIVGE